MSTLIKKSNLQSWNYGSSAKLSSSVTYNQPLGSNGRVPNPAVNVYYISAPAFSFRIRCELTTPGGVDMCAAIVEIDKYSLSRNTWQRGVVRAAVLDSNVDAGISLAQSFINSEWGYPTSRMNYYYNHNYGSSEISADSLWKVTITATSSKNLHIFGGSPTFYPYFYYDLYTAYNSSVSSVNPNLITQGNYIKRCPIGIFTNYNDDATFVEAQKAGKVGEYITSDTAHMCISKIK